MIIDCHGHYTTEPRALQAFRKQVDAAVTQADGRQTRRASYSSTRASTTCPASIPRLAIISTTRNAMSMH